MLPMEDWAWITWPPNIRMAATMPAKIGVGVDLFFILFMSCV
jgi:hypothetical protein